MTEFMLPSARLKAGSALFYFKKMTRPEVEPKNRDVSEVGREDNPAKS
jgi:hypothetical protein